jgi:hypothetical protein
VRYGLRTPWKSGTLHVDFERIDFIAKLAAPLRPTGALVSRFHGIFAPDASLHTQ